MNPPPRNLLPVFVLLCACLPARQVPAQPDAVPPATSGTPNILLIVADDLGYADVSFTGGGEIPTPQIDRIARNGIILTQFYVSQPFCAPSRAALLTGRFPQRFGMDNNPREPEDLEGMPPAEVTLAEVLRTVGHRTGIVGKWHLGATDDKHPNNQGFDSFYGTRFGGHQYFPGKKPGGKWGFYFDNIERNGQKVPHERYLTNVFTDEAIAFMEGSRGDAPFFLYLAYTAPHTPLEAPDDLKAEFEGRFKDDKRVTYAAMVRSLDNNVGRILDWLEADGLAEKTLVIFMSDNGGNTSQGASNAPFNGRKGDPLEGGVRVPFAAMWPGRIPAGTRSDAVVSAVDLFPTLCAIAGADTPEGIELDGRDFGSLLVSGGGDDVHQHLYWRQVEREILGIRDGDWKWGHTRNGLEFLFNIATDPHEKNNLLKREPERAAQLKEQFNTWSESMQPPAW